MSELNTTVAKSRPAPIHREAAQWAYRGIWAWLVQWLRVPDEAPTLPGHAGSFHRSFQPSREFLSYMRFNFGVGFGIVSTLLVVAWVAMLWLNVPLGIGFGVFVWFIAFPFALLIYLAIHLRYDTMWYVITDRSMRIRRGLWSIHEVTITFENVQTVKVTQGPLQRWFGIGNVEVRTAGGGVVAGPNGEARPMSGHHGIIEGVTNAAEIRDLILSQLKLSRTTGLGDEVHRPRPEVASSKPGGIHFGPEHLAVLREIRQAIVKG